MQMDALSTLQTALGADLLRAELLGAARPVIDARYHVQRFLGRGASGLVVAAFDRRLDRTVALKLSIATGQGTGMLTEARALARLDHPHVVRLHDVDVVSATFDGRAFKLWLVSMQLIQGSTMRAWLAAGERSVAEILKVYLEAGRGLAAAHEQRFVHRDFKPDNVLVREDGVAQVLDFGLAVTATRGEAVNLPSQAVGTEPYMAPEARRGMATAASDQYAFGLSLVEALTGEALPPTGTRPAWLSRALWNALRKATSAEASRRFHDMPELLAALTKAPVGASRWPLRIFAVCLVGTVGIALVATKGFPSAADGSGLRLQTVWGAILQGGDGGPSPVEAPAAVPAQSSIPALPSTASEPTCGPMRTSRTFVQALHGPKFFPGCYWLTVVHREPCTPKVTLVRHANEPSKNCADAGMARFVPHEGALVVEGLPGDPNLSLDLDVDGPQATEALKHGIPHGTLTVKYAGGAPLRARINGAVEKP
jgi:hypothetical protein